MHNYEPHRPMTTNQFTADVRAPGYRSDRELFLSVHWTKCVRPSTVNVCRRVRRRDVYWGGWGLGLGLGSRMG